ncbi:LytR family transcriptional regulator [Microbacterium lushaniae]|nr:LytR family transcriptional regulator [Microbacterium lushaniae]KAA9155469.1 LytR family transcriptional regulator [Microbacterium lushaniae]
MARRRRTVARHAHLTSPSIGGQLLTLVAVAVAVVLVAAAGTVAYATYDLAASFTEDAVVLEDQPAPPPDIGAIEGGVNLLVTGIDECEPEYAHFFGGRCTGKDATSRLNDVNILLHISDAPRRVTVVSFPRDLILQAPGCTRTDGSRWGGGTVQINELYSIGGLNCVANTVADVSDQEIPFAATVTFGGVIEITDAVGGVEVCLARGMRDKETGIDWPAGPRTIAGIEALQFLRTRYGVGGSDLARVSNQQQYMSRLARKLVSEEVLSDPATLYRLAATALRNVDPSTSLKPLTLVQIALAVKDVPFEEIVFVQYPTLTAPTDAYRVVPNYSAAEPLWQALAENRPIELTGGVGANNGVVEVTPEPTDPAAPPPTETAAPTPPSDAVALPPSVTGSTAAQETCSAGNLSD